MVEIDEVIERMVDMGSTVGYADMLGVFELFRNVVCAMMGEGVNVNTPFVNFRSGIKGNFVTHLDTYDSTRHQIIPSVSPGKRLRAYFKHKIRATRIETVNRIPNLHEFIDHFSGKKNDTVTPGNVGSITGHRLKFDPENSLQGIFFIDKKGSETRIETISSNFPSRLSFHLPLSLQKGEYRLEVRNDTSGVLKKILNVS
jgi:hypothetical protein